MKSALELKSVAGLRSRLERFGLDVEERGGEFLVVKVQTIATLTSVETLAAYVAGAEMVAPGPTGSPSKITKLSAV